MSMPLIRRDVGQMLAQTSIRIADAEEQIRSGTDLERTRAAGALEVLRRRKEELEHRLADIDGRPEGHETLMQWIKEEVFSLSLAIEGWVAGS